MTSYLESHRLPRLFLKGPDTTGPLDDVPAIRRFREGLVEPSGVTEPTVLVVNLEGRFPTTSVLMELILPLAKAARAGTHGPLALIVCTPDDYVRTVLSAVAQMHEVAIFVAPSPSQLDDAEPVGSLTPTERETLDVLHRLGGRSTIATFAKATGLEANAATNRLVNVVHKGFVQRVDRPRTQGQLFLDPRVASSAEEPADPTSADFEVPEPVRRDARALAEMQVREPGSFLANAWQEFLAQHGDYLAAEHERIADLVKRGDKERLAEVGRRDARKHAQARRKRQRQ